MTAPAPIQIYYIVDPMCSWCWGFRDTLLEFQDIVSAMPEVRWQYLMGGLAPDSDQPMPQQTQEMIRHHWQAVASRTCAKFNFDFWTKCQARRSTWASCRAVIAAGLQGSTYIPAMLLGIQQAYYLEAKNPSNDDCLMTVAREIGLNYERFITDFHADSVQQLFTEQRTRCQSFASIGASGFPALVVTVGQHSHCLSSGFMELDTLLQRWQAINKSVRSR